MQLDINKRYFYSLEGISSIKAHIEKLNNLEINDDFVKGNIEINASYTDIDGMECFKVISYPIEIEMSDIKVIDVNLGSVNIMVVENQGIEIDCDLVINYLADTEKNEVLEEVIELEPVVEVEPITNVTIEDNNELENEPINIVDEKSKDSDVEIDKIKEDISKNYEDKLAESLNAREENKVSTISHETRSNILTFLMNKSEKKYCLKSLYVEKEDDLNLISKEYKVPMSELLSGYDRNCKRVIFKVGR